MASNKLYHGQRFSSGDPYPLPDRVGVYLKVGPHGCRREEVSFSSGLTLDDFGVMAGRAVRLHRLVTGQDISLAEAERYFLAKFARACRRRAKLLYDKVNARLDAYEREHEERLRREAKREQQRALREARECLERETA